VAQWHCENQLLPAISQSNDMNQWTQENVKFEVTINQPVAPRYSHALTTESHGIVALQQLLAERFFLVVKTINW